MSATAATVKVVTVSSPKGDTEVHAPGCADLKKKNKGYQDAYTWTVSTAVELSHDFWSDQIGDEVDPDSPEGWAVAESWVGTFHFMPCCPAFPGDQPNTVRAAKAAARRPSHGMCDHAQTPQARRKCRNARKAAAAAK